MDFRTFPFSLAVASLLPSVPAFAADACQPIADAIVKTLSGPAATKSKTKSGAELEAVRNAVAKRQQLIEDSKIFEVKAKPRVRDYADSEFKEGAATVRPLLLKAVTPYLAGAGELSTKELYVAIDVVQRKLVLNDDFDWLTHVGYVTPETTRVTSIAVPIQKKIEATKTLSDHVVDELYTDAGLVRMAISERSAEGELIVGVGGAKFERKGDECRISELSYRGMNFDDADDYNATLDEKTCAAARAAKPVPASASPTAIFAAAKALLPDEGVGVEQLYGPNETYRTSAEKILHLNGQLRMRRGACARFSKFMRFASDRKTPSGTAGKPGAGGAPGAKNAGSGG